MTAMAMVLGPRNSYAELPFAARAASLVGLILLNTMFWGLAALALMWIVRRARPSRVVGRS
jgi:hypothetical protein